LTRARTRPKIPAMKRLLAMLGSVVSIGLLAACGDNGPPPGGGAGWVGAGCGAPGQCPSGYCCRSSQCGGGMCTYPCSNNAQCPYGTLCADGACFWACSSDANCGAGQACRHGHTVCQY
jgi:hypothetical protein